MITTTCTAFLPSSCSDSTESQLKFSSSMETLCLRDTPTYQKLLEYENTYENLYEDFKFIYNLPDSYELKQLKLKCMQQKLVCIYSLIVRLSLYYRVPINVPAAPLVGVEPNPGPTSLEIRQEISEVSALIADVSVQIENLFQIQGHVTHEQYGAFVLRRNELVELMGRLQDDLIDILIVESHADEGIEVEIDVEDDDDDDLSVISEEVIDVDETIPNTIDPLQVLIEASHRFFSMLLAYEREMDTNPSDALRAAINSTHQVLTHISQSLTQFGFGLLIEADNLQLVRLDNVEDEGFVDCDDEDQLGPLVGIEPNPGPTFLLVVVLFFFYNLLINLVIVYGNIVLGSIGYDIYHLWIFDVLILYFTDAFMCSVLLLVGIEPNPGPNSNLVSTRKRLLSKAIKRQERNIEKCQTKGIQQARKNKYISYQVEGLFDITFDNESKIFLKDVFGKFFSDPTINVQHKLTIDSTIVEWIMEFMKYVRNKGTQAYNLCIAIVRFILTSIDDTLEKAFSLLLGEVYFESEDFEVEMDTPYTLLCGFLYSNYLAEFVSQPSWNSFVKTILSIRQKGVETKSFVEAIRQIILEVTRFIAEISGVDFSDFVEIKDPLLEDVERQIKDVIDEYRNGIKDEYNFCFKVLTLLDEIENIIYKPRSVLKPQVKERLLYLLKKMQPIVNYCERNINMNNGTRVEPVAVLIAGPTGVGKSTFTTPFVLALLRNIIEENCIEAFLKNHNDFIFYRNTENEFWDGFKRRNVAIVFDDFGQRVDTKGTPNPDAFEIIRLKNMAPYHLHMAKIEEKEKNYAVPKILFATSNLPQIRFESIVCNEAVVRRFDVAVIQVPKLEYCYDDSDSSLNYWNRRLDLNKVRAKHPEIEGEVSSYFVADVMEYISWDFIKGCPSKEGAVYNLHTLIKHCVELHRKQEGRGNKMLQYQDMMKQYVVEMDDLNIKDAIYTSIESLSSNLYQKINNQVPKNLLEFGVAFMKFSGIVLSAFKVYENATRIYNTFSRFFFGKNDSQSGNSRGSVRNTPRKENKARARSNAAKAKKSVSNVAQAGDFDISLYLKLLKRNCYHLRHEGKILGWVTFIRGTIFIVPRHFDDYMMSRDKTIVELVNPYSHTVSIVFDWDKDLMLYDEHEDDEQPFDHLIFKLEDCKSRMHADISKYFQSSSQLRKGDIFNSQMAVMRNENLVFFNVSIHIDKDLSYEFENNTYKSRSLRYVSETMKGDCGSLLVCCEKRFSKPVILGFHTAGRINGMFANKPCLGVFLSKDEMDRCFDVFGLGSYEEEIPITEVDFEIEGFSTLSSVKQPRVPSKSKIIPSELHYDLWDITTKPANLKHFEHEGKILKPDNIARSNYRHNAIYIDTEKLQEATFLVSNLVNKRNFQPPWAPRLYTFEESVSGIDGIDYVDGISRSTSPGYPFVLDNKMKGKSYWFGSEGKVDFTTKESLEIQDLTYQMIQKAEKGVRSFNVYIDYLKDERRPITKVDAGKTRQFMACGMVYLIAVKMYFGDFIRHVCSNRILNGIAVGINPIEEWETLYDYLQYSSNSVFTAGDYSKYDAKIPVEIGYEVLNIIEDFYYNSSASDRKVREILFQDIINSLHISQGKVYEFVGGNPSGQPLTSIFNSVANLLVLTYCSRKIYEVIPSTISFAEIFNRTRFQVFGDDNIISYLPDDASYFSQSSLQDAVPIFVGMDYTNESKSDSIVEARNIFEISFLKRTFQKVEGRITAPLDLQVLKETLAWKKTDSRVEEMKNRIDCVCCEFAQHGEQVFEMHVPRIARLSNEHYNYIPKYKDFRRAFNANLSLAI